MATTASSDCRPACYEYWIPVWHVCVCYEHWSLFFLKGPQFPGTRSEGSHGATNFTTDLERWMTCKHEILSFPTYGPRKSETGGATGGPGHRRGAYNARWNSRANACGSHRVSPGLAGAVLGQTGGAFALAGAIAETEQAAQGCGKDGVRHWRLSRTFFSTGSARREQDARDGVAGCPRRCRACARPRDTPVRAHAHEAAGPTWRDSLA